MRYGKAPEAVGQFDISPTEMMFWLYLPVSAPGHEPRIPKQLRPFHDLVNAALGHSRFFAAMKDTHYAYVTAKTLYCAEGCLGGRPGWHTDGFGTDDINYIWADRDPTEFCVQSDLEISDDDQQSMLDMEAQCIKAIQYTPKTLHRIDPFVVHRIPPKMPAGMRTFFRLSISRDRYNYLGNSVNHELDLGWEYVPREEARNTTSPSALKEGE